MWHVPITVNMVNMVPTPVPVTRLYVSFLQEVNFDRGELASLCQHAEVWDDRSHLIIPEPRFIMNAFINTNVDLKA